MIGRRHFLEVAGLASAGFCMGISMPNLVNAAASPASFTETRILMGTFVGVSVAGVSRTQADEAFARAFDEATRLEALFSRHSSTTPVAELNRTGRLAHAPREVRTLLERAVRVTALTDGAFDVTVQPLVDMLRSHQNPRGELRLDVADVRAAHELVNTNALHFSDSIIAFERQGMGITLDGIAKGAIADAMSATLTAAGVHQHLVNAGGDIVARGSKTRETPWRVAIESPSGGAHVATLPLNNCAIATSGGYRMYYDAARKHHHLISPETGLSPTHITSASVLAPTALEADALATALSVMPPHAALQLIGALPSCEALLVVADGAVLKSKGWV